MCKVYGYCRVSTVRQSLKRQEDAIKELYPDAILITDSTTGRNFDRLGWTKMIKALKPGDTIVFDEVSRMSRDADEGFEIYQELFKKGINLIFIAEPHINTETYKKAMETGVPLTGTNVDFILEGVNKYLLSLAKEQIRLAFEKSQSEVDHNSRRTSKSLKEKQKRNEELKILHPDDYQNQPDFRQIGQPKGAKLTTKKSLKSKEVILKRSKDFNGNLSDLEVMKLTGIARGTYYKYKRELKAKYGQGTKVFKVNPKSVTVQEPKTITFEVESVPTEPKTITFEVESVPTEPKTITLEVESVPTEPKTFTIKR